MSKWDKLSSVGNGAPLKEQAAKPTDGKRRKLLNAVPARYFDAHEQLKQAGKTGLDFSNYIMEALREKLERDGAL